jgi:hypothetical protein
MTEAVELREELT